MKSLKLILGLALGTTGLGSTIAFGVANNVAENAGVIETKADYNVTISTPLDASDSTMRYWFINNQSGFWDGGAVFGIHSWGGGSVDAYYILNSYQNGSGSGQYFFYADIPTKATYFQLIRFASGVSVGTNKTVWGNTGDLKTSDYKPYYLHWCSGNTYPYVGTLSNSPCNNPRPSAYLMSKVLEAYNVCSSSELNGYGAASQIYTNWASLYDPSINGNWDEVKIKDYPEGSYSANNNSYSGLSKTSDFTVHNKWLALAAAQGINPDSGVSLSRVVSAIKNNDSVIPIMVITSSVLLVSFGTIFLIRKRKHQ